MTNHGHIPVLLEEVMHFLDISRKGIYIDGTIGLGGHSYSILSRNPNAELIGFDLDESSLLEAKENLSPFADRLELFHSDFRFFPDLKIDFSRVRGILIDLGLSSFQLDDPERGFSFNREGPLDMRMDRRSRITASKVINGYSESKLSNIFHTYGELRQSRRLAREIVSRRKNRPIETTSQLFQIVEDVCRWRAQKGKTHPAARVFQAIRIEINEELRFLESFLERIAEKTGPETRIVAISFHSLEDRIVKHTFLRLASDTDSTPMLKILTRKPVIPDSDETERNFRARSAKLRAAERI